KLELVLLNQINALADRFFDKHYLSNHLDFNSLQPQAKSSQLQSELCSLQDQSASLERKNEILYSDKLNGIITHEQYMKFKSKFEGESESLKKQQRAISEEIARIVNQESIPANKTDILDRFRSISILTQDMVNQLVESIYVYKRKKGEPQQIKINWNF
ncbi:MAG TPA: DUF4368 domain-containing protein, partial [Anaerovoracaceae bacterium]|nr:DUF4368 domain-containing protein [Anaerovoracaceae bacterium]